MVIARFPPVELADKSGFIGWGGDLEVSSLLLAYRSGIFPWPSSEDYIAWFAPPIRGVLFLDNLHISKSLRRERNRRNVTFAVDQEFNEVLTHCASQNRRGTAGTWITSEMVAAYSEFHNAGYAHSFECYEGGKLVGGGYGVKIGNFFSGESLFHTTPNASKLALWFFCDKLKEQGIEWIDCQMVTPLLKAFGAEEISRSQYMEMLKKVIG